MERTNRKQRYWRYTAWVMTLLAYAYLAYRLLTYDDWSSLAVCLRTADARAWLCGLVALLLMPLNMGLEAWRWRFLMGNRITMKEACRQVYFSKMAGQLTPYQLGEYPARGLLMQDPRWSELLSLGVVGSMTMTLAIVAAGAVPLVVWLGGDAPHTGWGVIALAMGAVVLLTALLPRLLRRWLTLDYRTLSVSLLQSLVRYLCWCIQLALVLRLFGITGAEVWLVRIPVYYLVITLAPAVSLAEVGVRGAAAIWVFGSVEATLAGMLLWTINSLLPMLIGTFVRKNAK